MTIFKQAVKKLKGYSEVLSLLSKEVDKKGRFDNDDLRLLKDIGSKLLFEGCSLDFILEDKHKERNLQ